MLEPPDLPDAKIAACLREHYGLAELALSFLPLGNDATAWAYRVSSTTGDAFLKIKLGAPSPASLGVPRWLADQGIIEIVAPKRVAPLSTASVPVAPLRVAPLSTASLPVAPFADQSGGLSVPLAGYSLALYPWIEGRTGMEIGLTPSQWAGFGRALRRVHRSRLPAWLAAQVVQEPFAPQWGARVAALAQRIRLETFSDPLERALADFWRARAEQIDRLAGRCAELGQALKALSAPLVLCHTDIHTANLLVDPLGGLHIVDWDQPLLAPVERDLMFFFNARGGRVAMDGPEQQAFLAGYGDVTPDPLGLAYYQYEWVVQEIGDFGQRVLARDSLGEVSRRAALAGFEKLFTPGDVVDVAEESTTEESTTDFLNGFHG